MSRHFRRRSWRAALLLPLAALLTGVFASAAHAGDYQLTARYTGNGAATQGWRVTWRVPTITNLSTANGYVFIGEWYAGAEAGLAHVGNTWSLYDFSTDTPNLTSAACPGKTWSNTGDLGTPCSFGTITAGSIVTFQEQRCNAAHVGVINGPDLCLSVDMHDGSGYHFMDGRSMSAPQRTQPADQYMYTHEIETNVLSPGQTNPAVSCDSAQAGAMLGQQIQNSAGAWTNLSGASTWNFGTEKSTYKFQNQSLTPAGGAAASWQWCGTPPPPATLGSPSVDFSTDGSTATISTPINPNGSATSSYVNYGTTSAEDGPTTWATQQTLGSGTTSVTASQQIGNLTPGKTYHYDIVAYGPQSGNEVHSNEYTFVAPVPPTVVGAVTASADTVSGEDISGQINPNGGPSYGRVDYGSSPTNLQGTALKSVGSGTAPVAYTGVLKGLTPGATYYYRLVATSLSSGETYGPLQTFVAPTPPSVVGATTATADSVSGTEDIASTLNPNGFASYGRVDIGTSTSNWQGKALTSIGSGTRPVPYAAKVSGLTPGVTYYYRVVATGYDNGETYSATQTFVAH